MNGYDAISRAQLAAHTEAASRPQPATSPQIRPRDAVTPLREAVSAADLEVLLVLLCGPEEGEDPLSGMMNEAPLNARRRNSLPASAFALPGRRYPIDTPERARSALARVEANGTPEEKHRVRAAVRRRYPGMSLSGGNQRA